MKRNATRRLLTALLAAAMCLSMAACGSKPAADNGSSDTDASAGDDAAKKYTIGVCQLFAVAAVFFAVFSACRSSFA